MKLTKKIFFTSLILATALSTSIQITAIRKKHQKINPHLTAREKRYIKNQIEENEALLDPKTALFSKDPNIIKARQKTIKDNTDLYYSNKPRITCNNASRIILKYHQ